MISMNELKEKKLLKTSKSLGMQYTTKLKDENIIYVLNKRSNIIYEINIVKDKRTSNKYFIKTEIFDKKKFVADGSIQGIFFDPLILAKIGATSKSKENIYFTVDDYIELYE